MTLNFKYQTPEYIGKFAQTISFKLCKMVFNGKIVGINGKYFKTTAISVAISCNNGRVFCGFSNYNPNNPTRYDNSSEFLNTRLSIVSDWIKNGHDNKVPAPKDKLKILL